MYFQLKPAVRQLSLAFPLLLIALPAAIKAADEHPGPALPPPSLYDTPAPSGQPLSTPSSITQPASPAAQPRPAPAAIERAPAAQAAPPQSTPAPVRATPSSAPAAQAAPPQSTPAPAPVRATPSSAPAAASAEPEQPWYKRWFGWVPTFSAPAAQKPVVADAGQTMSTLNSGERAQYAYASPSHAIRTSYGECVRTGWWTPGAASADCEPTLQRQQAAVQPPQVVAQAISPSAAGSAPVREITAAKTDNVEVVPLPPRPQPTRDELKPTAAKEQVVRDEIITALAATRPMAEPDWEKLTLSAGALFPLSSTTIKPLGREKLDELVTRLKEMDYASVHIVGHTDPTGPADMNEKLSKRRADAVKQYLVSKGIDAKRIQTEGKGGAQPLPKTRDCDALPRMEKIICYAPDRRVEIEVVGGKPRG
jgi:outer membrane protein OmpA-like peptidoglycan-associated protein